MRRLTAALLVASALLLGLVACGGDDDGDSTSPAAADETAQQTETAAADLTDTSVKPVVTVPPGSPPRALRKEDIVKGRGPAAQPGDSVTMHYVGVTFSTGGQFDASWDGGTPFGPFQLGSGQVIEGWDRGIVGMRVGGRRKLVIPPELAYGSVGQGPIGPNETLIFVVDLVAIG
ncbi:MAG TPA: FKBP-type peptidyl-prolyl cis-trans isomerase [Thermoleophilaceae bacterium]|nr:FKBP-type peptidyl-prolyl cis-trans isomerase [Thermoleophilaceae bacterium]